VAAGWQHANYNVNFAGISITHALPAPPPRPAHHFYKLHSRRAIVACVVEKITYTPAQFAEVFGKERSWAYRQLYAGKVQAITQLGRTLIPKSEVDRLLKEAGRYLGAKVKVGKGAAPPSSTMVPPPLSTGGTRWSDAVKQRRKRGQPPRENAHSAGDHKPSSQAPRRPYDQATSKRSVYQRLTRYKSSRKSDEGHDG
jgi:hypothetical protein